MAWPRSGERAASVGDWRPAVMAWPRGTGEQVVTWEARRNGLAERHRGREPAVMAWQLQGGAGGPQQHPRVVAGVQAHPDGLSAVRRYRADIRIGYTCS